jgi:hypothetical protein
MSLFRAVIVIGFAVLLVPIEEPQPDRLNGSPHSGGERSASFCARNPHTCAAGPELWATFTRKAEHAIQLAMRYAQQWLAGGAASNRPAGLISPRPGQGSHPQQDAPDWRATGLAKNPSTP